MAQLFMLMKYWDLFFTVVKMVEAAVPGDTPGSLKLKMAMDMVLKVQTDLSQFSDLLPQMFTFAKVVYTTLQSVSHPAVAAPAASA